MWPWIVTGVVALVLFPGLEDPESGYPKVMMEVMPPGLLGLALLSLVSAFMSTIDTHLNLGASYVTNDMYARFLKPNAPQTHYVRVSRISIVVLVLISCTIAWQIDSITNTWKFVLAFSSGAGLTLIARWVWWRANAWTEIVGMLSSGIAATAIKLVWPEIDHGILILSVVAISTPCWLIATFATPAVDKETLIAFYEKVHPRTPFWGEIPALSDPEPVAQQAMGGALLDVILGIAALLLVCFGTGTVILHSVALGMAMLATGAAVTWFLIRRV
jgi:Na+/proline symporter